MPLPHDRTLDASIPLFFGEGYRYISDHCRLLDSDAFTTRILLRPVVCMMGEEAAERFYQPGRFTRRKAMPRSALSLLQDQGSVMTAEGEDHHRRKAMFLAMMTPESMARMSELFALHWRVSTKRWEQLSGVVLFHAAHFPLCAAVCQWSGLQLTREEILDRAEECEAMVEGAGSFGRRNWRGQRLRSRSERWARRVVCEVQAGRMSAPPGSPLRAICFFREADGRLIDVPSAAVELINVIRPTVAVARYVVFAALALHQNPQIRESLAASDDELDAFAEEVRRFYPLIPAIGGRVLREFTWREHRFRSGDWVMFDLYGTNHDARIWGDPENFRPQRFRERRPGPFDLVSHGGGETRETHRCPGEWMTVELIRTAARLLAREMQYQVPQQDLRIDLSRIPALPASRFVINSVRLLQQPLRMAA